jgi:hypothetical protein
MLVACTCYVTVHSLLGHTAISIFQAHPELSGALTFMSIYYSVYLINLCRKAKIRDDLEARVHAHRQFTNELMRGSKIDITAQTQAMNRNIQDIGKRLITTENNLRKTHDRVEKRWAEAKSVREKIEEYKKGLLQLYRQHGEFAPQQKQEMPETAFVNAANVIREGAQFFTSQFPSVEEIPKIPQLEFLEAKTLIPFDETEEMKQNQLKQGALLKTMEATLDAIGPFLKKHPFSTTLLIGGLAMCILSGLALDFYFHGATNMYFFGALSITAILPMMMYGLSLVYEGYNSAIINGLEEELREIDENSRVKMQAIEQDLERLDNIKKTASATFDDFVSKWTAFQAIESEQLYKDIEAIEEATPWKSVEDVSKFLLDTLRPTNPDLSLPETKRVVQGYADGALIMGANLFAH